MSYLLLVDVVTRAHLILDVGENPGVLHDVLRWVTVHLILGFILGDPRLVYLVLEDGGVSAITMGTGSVWLKLFILLCRRCGETEGIGRYSGRSCLM